ncbi:MAG: glycosyltransferase family 39 protein [Candidatus Aureabacteria bacterium]|nr:glycosyltransferase family 39 protein [Candidatus Auribacterota bacterium]
MDRRITALCIIAIALAFTAGVRHPYLFGPDEPREAEIARETLVEGRWVTPHLCGLPFLEKPPLYYDCVAAAYRAAGRITPSVARSVSLLWGALMLAAVFTLGYRWRGAQTAWLATLVLLTMPRFWRYSHTILLDIAVGALCSWALTVFALAAIWKSGRRERRPLIIILALLAAAAFLTKGVVALFTIALIVIAFALIEKNGALLRELCAPLPFLAFAAPVALWLALYYREGGIGYLHEHFVNNILGRFLQRHFELPGVRYYHTDLGHRMPWYFYLQRLPEIVGPWLPILPIAAWRAWRGARRDPSAAEGQLLSFLMIWAFLPAIVFSFSGIKERTYILPSYSAMALLVGGWLDGALAPRTGPWRGAGWLWIVIPCALATHLSGRWGLVPLVIIAAAALLPGIAFCMTALSDRRWRETAWAAIAVLLAGTVLSSSPPLMYRHYARKCFHEMSRETWAIVGVNPLYFYRPGDNVRGSISFYGNRTIPELDIPDALLAALRRPERVYVIMEEGNYLELVRDRQFSGLLNMIHTPSFDRAPANRLLTNIPR